MSVIGPIYENYLTLGLNYGARLLYACLTGHWNRGGCGIVRAQYASSSHECRKLVSNPMFRERMAHHEIGI